MTAVNVSIEYPDFAFAPISPAVIPPELSTSGPRKESPAAAGQVQDFCGTAQTFTEPDIHHLALR
jgi:hypothetical protein